MNREDIRALQENEFINDVVCPAVDILIGYFAQRSVVGHISKYYRLQNLEDVLQAPFDFESVGNQQIWKSVSHSFPRHLEQTFRVLAALVSHDRSSKIPANVNVGVNLHAYRCRCQFDS